jgi:4-hydroxybenzoate polyprenyltransferase
MSTVPLTLKTPLPKRLSAWAAERFPPANWLLALALYLAALLAGRALAVPGPLSFSTTDVVGYAAVVAYFLMLRIFDEHKDYERDAANHPGRVLQRGLVRLDHLKLVGAGAIVVQLAGSLAIDGGVGKVTLWWTATMVWSLLMLKEFFVGEWLTRHFLLYASSHLLVTALAVLWMAQIGAGQHALPGSAAWLALMGLGIGASLEIARKVHPHQDERPDVDSYTKELGTGGATAALAVALAVVAVAAVLVLDRAGAGSEVTTAILFAAATAGAAAAGGFARRPTTAAALRVELVAGLAVLTQLLTICVAIVAARGV